MFDMIWMYWCFTNHIEFKLFVAGLVCLTSLKIAVKFLASNNIKG